MYFLAWKSAGPVSAQCTSTIPAKCDNVEKLNGKLWKIFSFCKTMHMVIRLARRYIFLITLSFQCIDHPPYLPDLAPSDLFLFPNPKKGILKERIFLNDLEAITESQYFSCQTWESMSQMCWTLGWICTIACMFHGSRSFPSLSGQELFSTHVIMHISVLNPHWVQVKHTKRTNNSHNKTKMWAWRFIMADKHMLMIP